jgi:hypothetical protein
MNVEKYRKLYLKENWEDNSFRMVTFYVDRNQTAEVLDYGRNHPKVISGEAYWVTSNSLCIGYILASKPSVFRPVFQYQRQRLLNKVNAQSHRKFWYNIYLRYMLSLPKMLPVECANHICSFLYTALCRCS